MNREVTVEIRRRTELLHTIKIDTNQIHQYTLLIDGVEIDITRLIALSNDVADTVPTKGNVIADDNPATE